MLAETLSCQEQPLGGVCQAAYVAFHYLAPQQTEVIHL